jgi:hypothetical protein
MYRQKKRVVPLRLSLSKPAAISISEFLGIKKNVFMYFINLFYLQTKLSVKQLYMICLLI